MKILVVGDWHSELHEEAVFGAFETLGHEVFRFSWFQFFAGPENGAFSAWSELWRKIQNKFIAGPLLQRVNTEFLELALTTCPDVIFIYRGTHITCRTLRALKMALPKTVLIGYNNDDPFAKGHPYWLWRHFLGSVPEYDLMLAYRHHNLEEFRSAGAKRVELLRSWYIPARNYPASLSLEDQHRYGTDVVFVGHYEPDGRLAMLEKIVQSGFRLKLFGPEWQNVIPKSPALSHLGPVSPVAGEDYNKALCGAKVALCFLSKLNRDTYTRRCFEIPASGTFMLSEYSEDLASMFKEGEEVEFFRSEEELAYKLKRYLENDDLRKSVAIRGCERVKADSHDVVARMKYVLERVSAIG